MRKNRLTPQPAGGPPCVVCGRPRSLPPSCDWLPHPPDPFDGLPPSPDYARCTVCGQQRRAHGCDGRACRAPGAFVAALRQLAPAMEAVIRAIADAKTVGEVRALRPVVDKAIARINEARRPT